MKLSIKNGFSLFEATHRICFIFRIFNLVLVFGYYPTKFIRLLKMDKLSESDFFRETEQIIWQSDYDFFDSASFDELWKLKEEIIREKLRLEKTNPDLLTEMGFVRFRELTHLAIHLAIYRRM